MADDWTLVEYRPGRYAKVTPAGDFLGMASTAEVQAWFAERRGRATPRSVPDFLAKRQEAPAETTPTGVEPPAQPAPPAGDKQPEEHDRVPSEPPVVDTEREDLSATPPDGRDVAPVLDGPPAAPLRKEPVDRGEVEAVAIPAQEGDLVDEEQAQVDAETESGAVEEEALPGEIDLATHGPEPLTGKATSPSAGSLIIEAAADRDGVDQWLWVDPRQESSYNPAGFDVATFLERAVALFESKAWTGGQKPRRLAVHPSQITDSLTPVAEALGLEVLGDSQISPGTYRLGLAEPGAGE